MAVGLHQPEKRKHTIDAFGGYNASHLQRLGEWQDMCNLSDRFSPFAAPRPVREVFLRLDGGEEVHDIIKKSGKYIYSVGGAIYFYPNRVPFHTASHSGNYRFLNIGSRVLCVHDNNADSGYLEFHESENTLSVRFVAFLNYEAKCSALDRNGDVFHPAFYSLLGSAASGYSGTVYDAAGQAVKTVSGIAAGGYDSGSEVFLNLAFKFCIEEDDGTLTVLKLAHICSQAEAEAMTKSQYYIAADKRLYRYDAVSGAHMEVETPRIALFVKTGLEPDGSKTPTPPAVETGDVIALSIGRTLNLTHPYAWKKGETGMEYNPNSGFSGNLKVARFACFDDNDSGLWHGTYGWDFYYIFEYDAMFADWIINNNLIHDSEHDKRKIDTSSTTSIDSLHFTPAAQPGALAAVTAEDIHFYPAGTQKYYPENFQVSTTLPDFSGGALVHNMRVWCADNIRHELRASALGNLKNWCDYAGLISDSYVASVDGDGDFRCCFAMGDTLYFLRENAVSVLYGSRPSNFCVNTLEGFPGPDSAGANSLRVIGRCAYYLACDGKVYCFDGRECERICTPLGNALVHCVSSAASLDKYYLLLESAGDKRLFVFNTRTGQWFVEDAENIVRLFSIDGRACALSVMTYTDELLHTSNCAELLYLEPWHAEDEGSRVQWFCESPLIGAQEENAACITELYLSVESGEGATVQVSVQFDQTGSFVPLCHFVSEKRQTKRVKIPLKRCKCFRLKLEGTGFSIIRKIGWSEREGGEK